MRNFILLMLSPLLLFSISCQNIVSDDELEPETFSKAAGNVDGEYVLIKDAGLILDDGIKLLFSDVLSDSRCPSSAVCIWMGQVEIAFTMENDGVINNLVLGLGDNIRNVAEWGSYKLELLEVNPYPDGNRQNFDDYSVKIRLSILNEN